MVFTSELVKERADLYLKQLYGADATYREGQYEAIEATLLHNRTLVVQKTGWGKSLVYFLATKILREQKGGTAVVISPLLALMDNQMEAANKLGLNCRCLNSTPSKEERATILQEWKNNELDMIFVTPETLFATDVQKVYSSGSVIGFFVVDEAHCISDWGHDFRLEYGMINRVLEYIPSHVPVLATTATANDRVVEDLKVQLGGEVFVSRGGLMRHNLSIQVLPLPDKSSRYSWILENMEKLEGSGIIYALTQRDCDYLANFLKSRDIDAVSYHSGKNKEENQAIELAFKNNEIKVLVATIKLGMGYDKGDIAFVIHFQTPANIVSYYQQIGRAGRNIPSAKTFIMTGDEDTEIHDHFIGHAFPEEQEMRDVYTAVLRSPDNKLKKTEIINLVNMPSKRTEKAICFLNRENFLVRDGSTSAYSGTVKPFQYNQEHYEKITKRKRDEQEEMRNLLQTTECYSRFVVNALDDMETDTCGVCGNCCPEQRFPIQASQKTLEEVQHHLNHLYFPILPRKKYPMGVKSPLGKSFLPYVCETGLALAKYGEAGFGKWVAEDKYDTEITRYRQELVKKSGEAIKETLPMDAIKGIAFVPSLRCQKVAHFAEDLATELGLPLYDFFTKTSSEPQKKMEHSHYQYRNAAGSFSLKEGVTLPKGVILVDDIVDSKWTLAVCGLLLGEQGCSVYPFTLADSGKGG